MSIYSGFATRQQEQTYDQCVETIMYILQRRILKFYKGQEADEEKFLFILSKLHSQMKSMQGHKYLQPKSSNTFQQLLTFLKNRENAKLLSKNKIEGVSNKQFLLTQNNEKKILSNENQVNILPVTAPKKQEPVVYKISQDFTQKYTGRNLQGREIYKYEQKQSQSMIRPITTQNQARIKKISSYKNSHQSHNNSDVDSLSFFDNQSSGLKNEKIQQKQDQNSGQKQLKHLQKTFQLSKQPLQHILNPSASRFIGISRKQTRSHMNKSYQSMKSRKSTLKSKEKDKEKQTLENNNEQQQGIKEKGGESDVRDLIKGYINKTKKNYIRAYKKRKNQIDQMLKYI